jgi:hypothetical protein
MTRKNLKRIFFFLLFFFLLMRDEALLTHDTRPACWEATCEPVVQLNGLWEVPDCHYVIDEATGERQLKARSTKALQ